MNMEVGNALTDDVVHGDECSLGVQGSFDGICEALSVGEKGADQISREIGQSFVVTFGN